MPLAIKSRNKVIRLLQKLGEAMHRTQEREVQKLEEIHCEIKHLEQQIDPLRKLLLDMEQVLKDRK